MFKPVKKNTFTFKSGSIQMTTKEKIFKSLKKINDLNGIPNNLQQIRIITQRVINSFDFILSIIAKHDLIDDITIVSYRISKKTIIELKDLQIKGKINKITIIISGGMRRLMPDVYNNIKSYESNNFILKEAESHAKITLAKTNNSFYVIEGSGNMSTNAKIEQYVFDNDETLYNFHKEWINNI